MLIASTPIPRAPDARLLIVDARGGTRDVERARLVEHLEPGDVVVANDAATLPASLPGFQRRTDTPLEIRLAAWRSWPHPTARDFTAIAFGEGDHRTRTEDRPPPPRLAPGDRLRLGPLEASVTRVLGHPRLVALRFAGPPDEMWAGIARHGRPIQYAHVPEPLALWDVWTRIAARPVAFEAPSATYALDWRALAALAGRGMAFATVTLAAGISSTGDPRLDARLPLDEPYTIPAATVRAIERARADGGRVVAVGTTVTRALEHAAAEGALRAGPGIATQRIGPATRLRVVDAIVTGVHEPGSSHLELLGAFAPAPLLDRVQRSLVARGYRAHEFGDSVLLARSTRRQRTSARLPP